MTTLSKRSGNAPKEALRVGARRQPIACRAPRPARSGEQLNSDAGVVGRQQPIVELGGRVRPKAYSATATTNASPPATARRPAGCGPARAGVGPSSPVVDGHAHPQSHRTGGLWFGLRPAPAGTGVASATGPLPEVVVGGIWDLGHGTYRCRAAFRGGRSQAAGGCDPLDKGRGHEPVAVRTRACRSRQQQPWNGGGIDGDGVHEVAHGPAAVLGLPGWPAEVGDDELAVVVVEVRPGRDEAPGEAARGGVAGVDLDADVGSRPIVPLRTEILPSARLQELKFAIAEAQPTP
jgi:hypothetical protein